MSGLKSLIKDQSYQELLVLMEHWNQYLSKECVALSLCVASPFAASHDSAPVAPHFICGPCVILVSPLPWNPSLSFLSAIANVLEIRGVADESVYPRAGLLCWKGYPPCSCLGKLRGTKDFIKGGRSALNSSQEGDLI